jgi:hypothetical protein
MYQLGAPALLTQSLRCGRADIRFVARETGSSAIGFMIAVLIEHCSVTGRAYRPARNRQPPAPRLHPPLSSASAGNRLKIMFMKHPGQVSRHHSVNCIGSPGFCVLTKPFIPSLLTSTRRASPALVTTISNFDRNARTFRRLIVFQPAGKRGSTVKERRPVGRIPNKPSVKTRQ